MLISYTLFAKLTLKYLKDNNEDYSHIEISAENALAYPENGILQDVPQVDPDEYNIPAE